MDVSVFPLSACASRVVFNPPSFVVALARFRRLGRLTAYPLRRASARREPSLVSLTFEARRIRPGPLGHSAALRSRGDVQPRGVLLGALRVLRFCIWRPSQRLPNFIHCHVTTRVMLVQTALARGLAWPKRRPQSLRVLVQPRLRERFGRRQRVTIPRVDIFSTHFFLRRRRTDGHRGRYPPHARPCVFQPASHTVGVAALRDFVRNLARFAARLRRQRSRRFRGVFGRED
mmetsp:Transcript_366/g.1448  ORF Transcript_366/g.1448 Transcript_366/m.1448 type:complete len:231 (-) Transcript_366:735-1427(-)